MAIIDDLQKFNNRLRRWEGDIGLEIETETKGSYEVPKFSFWETHADGSLRDFGIEYVLLCPLTFDKELKDALEEFKTKTEHIKFRQDSVTTSVHAHLNFLNDSWVTVFNFLTAYILTENLLVRYSGETRKSNLFCLPICDSEDIYTNIISLLHNVSRKQFIGLQIPEDAIKYGAINIGALYRYGSFEIRCYRGTTDIDEIYQWCSILHSIQKYARSVGLTPRIIVDTFKDKGSAILTDIFGEENRKKIGHIDETMLLEKNFWYAANLGYEIKDWSVLDSDPKKKKKSTPKDLEVIAQALFGVSFNSLSEGQRRQVLQTDISLISSQTAGTTATASNTGTTNWQALGIGTGELRINLETASIPPAHPEARLQYRVTNRETGEVIVRWTSDTTLVNEEIEYWSNEIGADNVLVEQRWA